MDWVRDTDVENVSIALRRVLTFLLNHRGQDL